MPSVIETISQLKEFFVRSEVKEKPLPDGRHAIRIEPVDLPSGCLPTSTAVLLIMTEGGEPNVYVKQAPDLPNGKRPQNLYPEMIDGEPWIRYSVNYPWNPGETAGRNLMGRLWRFASGD